VLLGCRRFVALKITVADLLDNSREARILILIAENSAADVEGSQHILGLLDNFQIEGPNGTHQVLVTEVLASLSELKHYPVYKKVTQNWILTSFEN
jgi:serine/threonine-protein kinase SRPK3